LVERYGCYACHKIDWFPTKRRPGPSLARIRQKTSEEFVSAWVTKPKASGHAAVPASCCGSWIPALA
jgi:hypothetical protein